MQRFILAIDQGTTGTTALLIDSEATVRASVTEEFEQIYPQPGWVEHCPEAIWSSVLQAIARVLQTAAISANQVAAIGIVNQRETTLLWQRDTAKPLHNAIVWQDRRTDDQCKQLAEKGLGPLYQQHTGLVLDPYFSGTKISWLLDHYDMDRKQAEEGALAFGTIDSYLIWRLTGGAAHVTDATNASRTLCFDIHTLEWSTQLTEPLGIPLAIFPQVCGCSEVYGATRNVPGLPDGIPIAGAAGDQQAALFGQACFDAGAAKCTYGTGAFLLVNTGKTPVHSQGGMLTTLAWVLDGQPTYALEGSVFIAGAVVQWLRDGLGLIQSAAEIGELASRCPDSGGVVFVPALTGLGAPHWRPDARGAITGITRGTTAAQIARAALEGIAFQVNDLAAAMTSDLGHTLASFRVDGGATANDLLMQFQADILGQPITRPVTTETTALGAAFLAGLAVGMWDDLSVIASRWKPDRTYAPQMSAADRKHHMVRWNQAIARV